MFSFHPESVQASGGSGSLASPPREHLAKPGDIFLLMAGRKDAFCIL